jgi:hypothetical protein
MSRRVFVLVLAFLLLRALSVWAALPTDAAYVTLKQDILVTHGAEFAALVAAADWGGIANAYNVPASPAFWVWKSVLREQEVYESTSVDGTVWDWDPYIAQTAAEHDAWGRMFNAGQINPSLPQTRTGFLKIFKGSTAPITAQRTHLLALSRRSALRGEVLFAVTTAGDGSAATPANAVFEGKITYPDVYRAVVHTP